MTLDRSLMLSGRLIKYELTRKDVKNINMRIVDSKVMISASKKVSIEAIEAFILSKSAWILESIDKYQKSLAKADSSNSFTLLGIRYDIIYTNQYPALELNGNTFYVGGNNSTAQFLLHSYAQSQFENMVEKIHDNVACFFCQFNVPRATISYKKYKSRWGCCDRQQKIIILNSILMHIPIECIEYVVVHEYAHFICGDHSAKFHSIVASALPDHKARREKLKQWSALL